MALHWSRDADIEEVELGGRCFVSMVGSRSCGWAIGVDVEAAEVEEERFPGVRSRLGIDR